MVCRASQMKLVCVFLLLFVVFAPALHGKEVVVQISGNRAKSAVPAWDARGLGPMNWQGIACADLSPDGRFTVLGTIAQYGDPQVFLLDAQGKITGQYQAGERGVSEVAVLPDGTQAACIITTPHGAAGDSPQLRFYAQGKPAAVRVDENALGYNDLFHYGDHSNHYGQVFRTTATGMVFAAAGRVNWLKADFPQQSVYASGDPLISLAASASGRVVVGGVVSARARNDKSVNLTVLDPDGKPVWQRPVSDDVTAAPAMEAGVYGHIVSPFEDVKVWAPLSVAISTDGSLVAAADYQGWRRYFSRGDDYGLRFMPVRPVIQVYTADGKPVFRVAPETFTAPGWYDLAFTPDNKRLLAYPHNWTSRGLAGQPRLPADADARSLYALELATGDVTRADFPDAISSVAVGGNGVLAVSCWNGIIYLRGADLQPMGVVRPDQLVVGAPCVLHMSRDGGKLLAAGADGVARLFDIEGTELWKTDLKTAATPGEKPWKGQRCGQIGPGVWVKGGARTESDLGGQYIIEAPEGLLLIDPNSGLCFDQNWESIKNAGLDPMKVKYILPTHEHGDHSPGSYLWRVVTGAQVVSSPEMAYTMQHHIFIGTGYGLHPPQPTDILVDHDQELTLAGLKVRVVYLSGHTYGSLGYLFEMGGKKYAALGDLIMPGGTLGYSGSINFSPQDVLDSLRKLETYKPDFILGGHGAGDPNNFIARGISAGEATGWGKMTPIKPDPFYTFTQRNYLVFDWQKPINSAAYGDMDGDGKPDVATLINDGKNAQLRIYLNKGGKFGDMPDIVQPVPDFMPDMLTKIRMVHIGTGKKCDFVAGSESQTVILLAQEGAPAYRIARLPGVNRITQVMTGDFNNDGRTDLLLGGRFIGGFSYALQNADGTFQAAEGAASKSLMDMQLLDVNGDKLDDLITAAGEIFLRQPDGKVSTKPDIQLAVPTSPRADPGWSYMAAADFNGDGKPDIALLINDQRDGTRVAMYYHTGDMKQPYANAPTVAFNVPGTWVLRDGPTTVDWNSDGWPDLMLAGNGGATIMFGSAQGLDARRTETVKLDYNPYYDNRLGAADFTGNGQLDLAGWGSMSTGAVGLYIWTR